MKKPGDYGKLLRSMLREWKWLFGYISKYKFTVALYIAIGLVTTAMSLGVSVASKYLIDAVVLHVNETLIKYAVLVVGLSVFQYVFSSLTAWITATVSSRANNEIREDIYSHIITAEWEDIGVFHSGDLLNRLESDVSTISSGVINFIPSVFTRSLQFFGSLCIVLYYDKTMALLALMSAPFLFVSSRFLVKTIRKYNKQTRELNGKILSFTEESVQNIQLIKAFDLTKRYIDNFRAVLEAYRHTRLEYEKFSILLTLCLSVIGLAVSYTCYGWGVYRLWQGVITYGTMTLFLQISGNLTASFGSLASLAPTAVTIATAAGRVMEVTTFDEEKDSDKKQALAVLQEAAGKGVSLVMQDVSFKYRDGDDFVLKNVNITAKPGETIAFVGPSGEGKTTMLKLILGIVGSTQGEMYLETQGGSTVKVSDSTRRFCSYVPQSINIFSGTIAENLRMVNPDATDEELENVIKIADLGEMIEQLPEGINTVVNEHGANFSQGQLQRLAIARALLRESMILLMDEATSALDSETEKRVLENIMINNPSRICIITTHRESMLKYCDKVYRVTSAGELTEESNGNNDIGE